jgi:2-keto-4-pentenoate hydratase
MSTTHCERRADTPTIPHPTLPRTSLSLSGRTNSHVPVAVAVAGCETAIVSAEDRAAVARGARAMLGRREDELAAGATSLGWKMGFTTPAIQAHFGLSEPVVGYLVDAGLAPDGATIQIGDWIAPAVEVEVAIRIGTGSEVAGLAPALELVDLGEPFADIEAALGGNIWQRGVIFGPEVPGAEPWAMVARVTRTSTATAPGTPGTAVAGAGADVVTETVAEGRLGEDPAATLAFATAFLATHGATVMPGDRIIAGSVVAPVAVAPGDALSVDFGPLGHLSVSFA